MKGLRLLTRIEVEAMPPATRDARIRNWRHLVDQLRREHENRYPHTRQTPEPVRHFPIELGRITPDLNGVGATVARGLRESA